MPAQSLIQIRVDRPLKDDVSALFASLGIDMSTAVRMFFQRWHHAFCMPIEDVRDHTLS